MRITVNNRYSVVIGINGVGDIAHFNSGGAYVYNTLTCFSYILLSSVSQIILNNTWYTWYGTANGVYNSLIFQHIASGINSY